MLEPFLSRSRGRVVNRKMTDGLLRKGSRRAIGENLIAYSEQGFGMKTSTYEKASKVAKLQQQPQIQITMTFSSIPLWDKGRD